jgi:hypothetical protein
MIDFYLDFEIEDDLQLPYNYWLFDRFEDADKQLNDSEIQQGSFYKPIIKLD